MLVDGCVALVTGSNRGIGAAYVSSLLTAGASKVYATSRISPEGAPEDPRIVPLQLDVTDHAQVCRAAERASDVTVLINNAGVNYNRGLVTHDDALHARHEIEVNYLGKLDMCRHFAPVLAANGGGAMVNMLSILGRVMMPQLGSLSASKAAALSMTIGVRAELAAQGTLVMAVLPGPVDTRMTAGIDMPKLQPAEVVSAVLEALELGQEDVVIGEMAENWALDHSQDPKRLEKVMAAFLPAASAAVTPLP